LDVPFAYATNGLKIIEYDFFTKQTRELDKFPSPNELWRRFIERKRIIEPINKLTEEKRIVKNPLEIPYYIRDKKPRYYQEVAVRRTIEEILLGRRRILLTMATGSGKTYVAFQIAWKLYHSGLVKKILFVVDRVYLRNPERNGKKVYQHFDPDYFDLVIIDECHRSGWNRWHDILQYFSNAIHLGLTATPKRNDNVDVYRYFGKPVYEYKLAQGIEDGYLAPPEEIIRVYTNIDKEGKISFKELRTAGVQLEEKKYFYQIGREL